MKPWRVGDGVKTVFCGQVIHGRLLGIEGGLATVLWTEPGITSDWPLRGLVADDGEPRYLSGPAAGWMLTCTQPPDARPLFLVEENDRGGALWSTDRAEANVYQTLGEAVSSLADLRPAEGLDFNVVPVDGIDGYLDA